MQGTERRRPDLILRQLRQETADLHEALEAALPLGAMDLTASQYARVLQMFYGFFAAWEPLAVEAAPPFLKPFVAERARLALLRADLGDLGCSLPATVAGYLPDITTIPALLGSMYVVEGSRLGGQVLVRSLAPRLHLTPERGLRFFYGFGPQTGAQWKLFGGRVEELVDAADAPQAVAAARATFSAMHNWITASGIAAPASISVLD